MDATILGQYNPPYTYPNRNSILQLLLFFPSILLKINALPMWYEIWKGREKLSKGRFELGSIVSKWL